MEWLDLQLLIAKVKRLHGEEKQRRKEKKGTPNLKGLSLGLALLAIACYLVTMAHEVSFKSGVVLAAVSVPIAISGFVIAIFEGVEGH